VESPQQRRRHNFLHVPLAYRPPDRVKERVLPDSLTAAQEQRVIDLLLWMLHTMREPPHDMFSVVRVESGDVIEPDSSLASVAEFNVRRPIKVEGRAAMSTHPSAIRDQPILDQHRLAGRPRHLFNRAILIEPRIRPDILL